MALSNSAIKEIEGLEQEKPLFLSVSKLKNGEVAEFIADFSTATDKVHDMVSQSKTLIIKCFVKYWVNCEVCYSEEDFEIHFPLKTFVRRLFQGFKISIVDNHKKYYIKLRKKYSKGKNYGFDILSCKEVKEDE